MGAWSHRATAVSHTFSVRSLRPPPASTLKYWLIPITVDPHRESGQSLYRQYAGKKGKIVLNVQWVHECVKAGALQTYHTNWAECKVTGTETLVMVKACGACD